MVEDKKKKRREYMRKYNATKKGAEYNRKHVKEWRKRTKTPHGNRKQSSATYRDIIVDFLLRRDGRVCGICQQTLEGSIFHINHKIPVALGGPDTMDNIELTHPKCNLSQAMDIRKQSHGY